MPSSAASRAARCRLARPAACATSNDPQRRSSGVSQKPIGGSRDESRSLDGELCLGAVGENLKRESGVATRGVVPRRGFGLEKHDVARAATAEMVGGRGTGEPGSEDDDVCGLAHAFLPARN